MKLKVSGWDVSEPFYGIKEDYYNATLSDHADFAGLLEYIKLTQAKLVITDNVRAGDASALAEAVKENLGIAAYPLPASSR